MTRQRSFSLRRTLQEQRNKRSLVFLGSGFVTSGSARVFIPLIGCPKRVPSPEEEHRFDAAFPKWWQVIVFVLIATLIGGASINGASMPPTVGRLLFPASIGIALGIWCWRERALTRAWQLLDARESSRTKLILSYLARWPTSELVSHLAGLAVFLAFMSYSTRLADWPSLSVFEVEPHRFLALSLFCLLAFLFVRAAYWLGAALTLRFLNRPA